MRLVNKNNDFVVVEFKGNNTVIYDNLLKKEMEEVGVQIPYVFRAHYGGKLVVKFGDDLFQRAFKEVFYPSKLNQETYRWEDDNRV